MLKERNEEIKLKQWEDITSIIGKETSDLLMEKLGGMHIYVPQNYLSSRKFRNYKIFYEFNGQNVRELAYKHQLSDRQIRRIIAQVGGNKSKKQPGKR